MTTIGTRLPRRLTEQLWRSRLLILAQAEDLLRQAKARNRHPSIADKDDGPVPYHSTNDKETL